MEEKEILEEMNTIISSYCLQVCNCLCCKTGQLAITNNDEFEAFKKIAHKEFEVQERYETKLITLSPACPLLNGVECKLYNSENRPKACRRFPLYIRRRTIIVATWCPAFQEGILDDLLLRLENEGFVIIK